MGSNSQTTNQSQSSQFSPWGIAIPGLENLNGQLTNLTGNVSPTGAQQGALGALQQGANAIPTNMGSQGTGVVNNLLGSSTAPNQGMWNQALQTSQGVWNPILNNPNYTNPMNTPGFGQAMSTMNQDITNQINSQFAAAGREDSPANTQALARGLSQGEGGLISGEFNTLTGNQLGAANSALSGAGSTAAGTAQLQQLPYMNQVQALTAMQGIPGLYTAPGTAQLGAANTAYGLPYSNIQMPLTEEGAIGGMGGTSSGTGTSTTTQPMNPWTTALGLGLAGASLFGNSDRRLKTDIKKVGKTKGGDKLYEYRFKGRPDKQVGVMAQDVEKRHPEDVVNLGLWKGGGPKAVDYGAVMRRAA